MTRSSHPFSTAAASRAGRVSSFWKIDPVAGYCFGLACALLLFLAGFDRALFEEKNMAFPQYDSK